MTILSSGSTYALTIPAGNALVTIDLSGTSTVTGVTREDASRWHGTGAKACNPVATATAITISTTGQVDYRFVAGDATPSSEVVRYNPVTYDSSSADAAAVAAAMGGGFIYQRLLSASIKAKNNNPFDLPVMSSPPTVTVGAAALANPVSYGYLDTGGPRRILLLGVPFGDRSLMVDEPRSGYVRSRVLQGAATFSNGQRGYVAKSKVTAQKVQFNVDGLSVALLRFRVNGALVSASGTSAGLTNVELDFGARVTAEVAIEFEQSQQLKGITVDQDDTVYSFEDLPEPVPVIGDSYFYGVASPQVLGVSGLGGQTLPAALREVSGLNIIPLGIAATGYTTQVNAYKLATPERLAYIVSVINASGARLSVIFLGTNDVGASTATITAEASASLDYLLANTTSKYVVFGAAPQARDLSANLLATDNAILAAVNSKDKTRVAFADVNGIAGGVPWVKGTKSTSNASGTAGNSRTVTGDDNTHLSPTYGTEYFARKISEALLAATKSKNW